MIRIRPSAGRRWGLAFALVAGAAVLAGCDKPPTTPTPPPPTPPPVVTAPVITGLTVAVVTRTEVDRDVAISAEVQDAEKSPDALSYVWSSNVGAFTGSGRSVTWKLASGVAETPVEVTVSVTVVEPYQVLEGGQLVTREHRVTQSAAPFRVHDSKAEITKMVRTFLIDLFGDINKSPDACLVDFSDRCPGKAAERVDIVKVRAEYSDILDVQVGTPEFGFDQAVTAATISAPCVFRATQKNGTLEAWAGDCDLTAVYEQNRWWLCSSEFNNEVPIAVAAPLTNGPLRSVDAVAGRFPFLFR
jgi:hypothetical protein